MNRARTYHCTRMRHCIEQSNGLVPSLLCPSWVDCIIATRGYDFRKGQLLEAISAALDLPDRVVDRAAQVSQHLLAERQRRHFELQETTGHADKSTGSVVPYLRLISD